MTAIESVRLIVLFFHFMGLAAVVGPFILQVRGRGALDLRTMLIGSIAQIATGILLVALRPLEGLETDPSKIAVKLGVAVLVLAAMIGATVTERGVTSRVRTSSATVGLFRVAGGLAIVDIAVAVLWR